MTEEEIKLIDLSEDEILSWGQGILQTLLLDRTTGRNIYWATEDYKEKGEGYMFFDEITIDKITGKNSRTIQPRILKGKHDQIERAKNMAEVFTPSWICNAQNNLIDEAWFKRKNVFNIPSEEGLHSWTPVTEKIVLFPDGKNWQSYVTATRMEMACGEAPYICSRFDATTGLFFSDLNMRVGLLDRKLRIVSENTHEGRERDRTAGWRKWAQKAYQSIYAFEWQGDNLLLARESLLWSYREYYKERWGDYPKSNALRKIAEIISWNVWQMDGLTCGLPGRKVIESPDQIENLDIEIPPEQKLCRVMEWSPSFSPMGTPIMFKKLIKQ
jgi:hypothetical protein